MFPGLRPRVQRCKSHGQLLRVCSRGRVRVICSAASWEWPPCLPPSVRFCYAPARLAAAQISAAPRGHREPLAVPRLYGPPLRPAEASPGQREASGRQRRCRLRGSLRAVIASISLRLRAVAWCENASPGRTGAAASAAAARAVGGGRGGGEVRGGDGRGCFFSFSLQSGGFVSRSQRVSPWAGRTFFLVPVRRGPPGA